MSEANKTRDKNVANIEDDVKRCNELIKVEHANWIGISNQLAISHILAEREQMLKEREKYTIRLTDEEYRKVIESAQMDTSNDRVIAHKFAVMQQQLEQKNNRIQELEEEKNKYLQKLVYALSPTRHVLGDDYNDAFKKIIAENIDLETCKIRQKLKECWGIDKKILEGEK